jgi:hypothetical protein
MRKGLNSFQTLLCFDRKLVTKPGVLRVIKIHGLSDFCLSTGKKSNPHLLDNLLKTFSAVSAEIFPASKAATLSSTSFRHFASIFSFPTGAKLKKSRFSNSAFTVGGPIVGLTVMAPDTRNRKATAIL